MVRAGHVSNLQKIKTPAAARIKTTSASAIGHEVFPELAELSIGPSRTGIVGRSTVSVFFTPKKYRPPRPMGVKGGCSPQNNLPKSAELLNELKAARNRNF